LLDQIGKDPAAIECSHPKESGAALARLVTDPNFADTNGKYFEQKTEIRSSDDSYDRKRATEL